MAGAVRGGRAAGTSFSHRAFVYGSPEEFVDVLAPFVRAGIERGDAVFAAAKRANVEALGDELGTAAGLIELRDASEWCTRPYDRLQAILQFMDGVPGGKAVRAVGEPVWDGSDAIVRQWARYESVLNAALVDSPLDIVCAYDGGGLPDHVLDYAAGTHPERIEDGSPVPCAAFVPPGEFVPGPPPTRPPDALELPPEGAAFRWLVAERGLAAGLSQERVDAFVLATSEVAVNALAHGRPPVHAWLWTEGDDLVCQVTDAGAGIVDPLAGWLPPESSANDGWGLTLAQQLCDVVEIAGDRSGGTVVSLYVSPTRRPPAATWNRPI